MEHIASTILWILAIAFFINKIKIHIKALFALFTSILVEKHKYWANLNREVPEETVQNKD